MQVFSGTHRCMWLWDSMHPADAHLLGTQVNWHVDLGSEHCVRSNIAAIFYPAFSNSGARPETEEWAPTAAAASPHRRQGAAKAARPAAAAYWGKWQAGAAAATLQSRRQAVGS